MGAANQGVTDRLATGIAAVLVYAGPAIAILAGVMFVAGMIGTGIPIVDQTAAQGADGLKWLVTPETTEDEREAELEQAIHREVNEVRTDHSIAAVGFDDDVAAVARNHSQDMAEWDYFSHKDPDGDSSADRLREAGVQCQASGENLYSHEGYGTKANETADRVIEQWLDSPGHRENLLREGWAVEGIGVEIRGDEVWVTQVFCS